MLVQFENISKRITNTVSGQDETHSGIEIWITCRQAVCCWHHGCFSHYTYTHNVHWVWQISVSTFAQ